MEQNVRDVISGDVSQNHSSPALSARLLLGAGFLAYFATTALLYFFGPWYYPMPLGSGRLIAFLVAVHVAFGAGYVVGVRGRPAAGSAGLSVERLVLLAVLAELILLVPTSVFNTGHWLPTPWVAAGDFASAYTMSLARRESGTPYVNYVRMVLAPLLVIAVPLGVFYWRRLSWYTRVLFVVSVIGTIALFIAMGANAGAAHWMVLFPWFIVAGHLSGVQRLDSKGWAVAGAVQVSSVVLFVLLFSATMVQRTGSYAKDGYIPGIGAAIDGASGAPAGLDPAGSNTEPTAPVPAGRSEARIGAHGLAAYLTQGYFAVYLSLQEPFMPCYGVGNSVFLQRQAARITGNARLLECAYPLRIRARGWQASALWATIYPWIASDVTFPGTVLVIALIGWLAGRVWLDVLGGENFLAVALLGQLLLLLYYVPAHNKMMHSGEGVFAFGALLIAWAASRAAMPPGTET